MGKMCTLGGKGKWEVLEEGKRSGRHQNCIERNGTAERKRKASILTGISGMHRDTPPTAK